MTKPSQRIVTITDVAAAADVSIGTVSRFLNNRPVKDDNRERIAQAISELGYRRNILASVMKASKTGVIGILVPNLDSFHSELTARLMARLRAMGLMALTHVHDNSPETVAAALDFFRNFKVDALILGGSQDHVAAITELVEGGTRVITYDNPHAKLALDSVEVDNVNGAEAAVRHLIEAGHSRIGVISGNWGHGTSIARLEGWRRALLSAGHDPSADLVELGNWSRVGGAEAMARLLDRPDPPTAVFGISFRMTIGAITHLRSVGMRIPDDMSVVSFDDAEVFQQSTPAITAVAQPIDDIADALTARVAHINGQNPADDSAAITKRLTCNLIIRDSVAPPRTSVKGNN